MLPSLSSPASEQRRIVEAIDSYLTRLDDAVASLERVQAKLKAYRASVLKAAVEGRLVPTEASLARAEKRDYEPAEALLARILKERRRRWEEAELAKLKAAGKTPKDDKWKARYEEPVAPDTSTSGASRGVVLGDVWTVARRHELGPINGPTCSHEGNGVPFISCVATSRTGLDFDESRDVISQATTTLPATIRRLLIYEGWHR